MKYTFKSINIAKKIMKEIFGLHGVPKTVISDCDVKFTSNFWKSLFKGLETNMNFSMSYHPQTNGENKRTNTMSKDMLCMYVKDMPKQWEEYLHLIEFAYNNGY